MDDIDTTPISEKLHLTVQLAMRFNNSAEQTMLIINSLLKELNRDDLMVSASGIRKLKKRLMDEAIKKRECEDQGLVCIKFDGKKGATKQAKNKTKSVDNYTVIKEPKELYRNGGKDLFTFSAVNLGRMAESKSRGLSVLSTAS